MARPKVAILGSSADRSKYGDRSLRAHRRAGHEVFPINPNVSQVEGLPAFASLDDLPVDRLDRVSAYVPPGVLLGLLDQVAREGVGEIWLNPGTDTAEVVARDEAPGLNVVRGCSILDVG